MTTLYGIRNIEPVTSPANPLVKEVRRAVSRGAATADGLWVSEGFHLLEEALRSGCEVRPVLASEAVLSRVEGAVGAPARLLALPEKLFQTIAATETSQGVIALVRPPEVRTESLFEGCAMIAVLDSVQDPGNAGAIVRAAEAFGATGVIFTKGSAAPEHPKTLRASMGSLFRVPFLAGMAAEQAVTQLRERDVTIYAAMPFTGSEVRVGDADFSRPCAIAIGNEGRGVGEVLRDAAIPVAIPTAGVESLNAAVAAAVLFYETRRQRT